MFLPLAPNIFVTPCKDSRCCYMPSLQICEMPSFEGGFLLLQRKNTKKKKKTPPLKKKEWGRNTNCYLILVSPGSISVLPSRLKKKHQKKKNQKKQQNKTKRTTIAKKRELNTILCSSISFPMALNWQHNSPLSSE